MLPDLRVRQRDYLLEITRSMTEELNLDRLLVRILRLSAEILAGQAGVVLLRGQDGAGDKSWKLSASHGINPAFLRYLDPLLTQIPLHEDPARFELPELNRLLQELTRTASLGLLTGVGLPLIAHQRVIGVIFIFRSYAARFSRNDLTLLQSFADQAAIAVNNAQVYDQSRREQHRMSAILDSVADGMLILTADHTIERCNPAFANMWGMPVAEIQGQNHDDLIQWIRHPQGMILSEAEAGGWPLTPNATLYVEGDLSRPGGVPLPAGVTYSPVIGADGVLLNVITTVRDLSRFREAEELKSTFISVISHELKTPVALIKGYVSTLRREDASWDREIIEDSLEVIEEESDRLGEMIENLLDATRLQAGGLKLNLADLSLPQLAERLAERFRTQSDVHTIVVDFPEEFPIILGDETRVGQVLSNLISNGIKYSSRAGEIRVSGRALSGQVVVCVSDQGPGIAPGDIPHVFDRFYRADQASRTTKGAGLGLYLSRAVIEAHGGRIWVDPKPGEGARICFSLPRNES
ncbi:MAG TPA: ATP-binding protein [Anaerolineales bacterium]|nr:ATP-binding protein [Anaerolineales bacterium]